MQGVSRGTQYGYSIYEMQVFGAVQAKAPTITPVSGTYKGTQTVTMSTAVKGAEIKYTTDGATPTEDSATYEGPITVDKSVTIKAVTYRKGMLLSDPVQSDIIIEGTISLNKTEATVAIGNKLQLSAITDQSVTFSSDNAGVAKVDAVSYTHLAVTATKADTAEFVFDEAVDAQFVKILCKKDGFGYPYSIWEVGAFGTEKGEGVTTVAPTTVAPAQDETYVYKRQVTELSPTMVYRSSCGKHKERK